MPDASPTAEIDLIPWFRSLGAKIDAVDGKLDALAKKPGTATANTSAGGKDAAAVPVPAEKATVGMHPDDGPSESIAVPVPNDAADHFPMSPASVLICVAIIALLVWNFITSVEIRRLNKMATNLAALQAAVQQQTTTSQALTAVVPAVQAAAADDAALAPIIQQMATNNAADQASLAALQALAPTT
jgi:hypothetical protein